MKRIRTSILIVLTILLTMLPLPVGAAAAAKETVILNADTVWHYWDEGSDPVKSGDRLSCSSKRKGNNRVKKR